MLFVIDGSGKNLREELGRCVEAIIGKRSGLSQIFRRETAAQLLHATLQMEHFSPTEMSLNRTKYWKVGVYDTGRLN